MALNKELRRIVREKLKEDKKKQCKSQRPADEQLWVDDFIKERLKKEAESGERVAVFSAKKEHFKSKYVDEWIYLNPDDFELFARKHHLQIKFADNYLREEYKITAKKVMIYF